MGFNIIFALIHPLTYLWPNLAGVGAANRTQNLAKESDLRTYISYTYNVHVCLSIYLWCVCIHIWVFITLRTLNKMTLGRAGFILCPLPSSDHSIQYLSPQMKQSKWSAVLQWALISYSTLINRLFSR